LARVLRRIGADAPWDRLFAALERAAGPDRAALAAVDIALHDRAGRRDRRPVWALLGADPRRSPLTCFSIGLDALPAMQERAREAADFPILKIKLDGRDDRAIVTAIRRVTDRPLYVDANEAWTDRRAAVGMVRWLAGEGVVLVEQPMPAADFDGARYLRDRVDLPLFADEAARTEADVPSLAGAYDGINIKVQKAGGLRASCRMLEAARRSGMKVMIGCMIETSIGITAAAHLAPLADYADLDGHLLLARDPFRGVRVVRGRLILPPGPGLGVEPAR
jgi:L-alanine-DL-glutamate epimerase-like enolase superfamily enzyme